MSDSYRFIAFGKLYDQHGQVHLEGPFYIKEENGWRIYIHDNDEMIASFDVAGRTLGNFEYTPANLSGLIGLTTREGFILRDLLWVGDLVDHKHIDLHKTGHS